jgi:hypothetical protein
VLPQNYGQWFRGETLPWVASNKLKFKNDYLSKARNMQAPEIAEFVFQFTGSVGGVTATALAIDAPKLFSRFNIKDKDVRCDASGAVMFGLNMVEFGAPVLGYTPAAVASGATNTAYSFMNVIPYEFEQASWRETDYRIPAPYILEGGIIQANCAAAVPTGYAAAQSDWNVTVWSRVQDARVRELKSTLCYEQFNTTRSEDYFPIQGSARNILGMTDLTTTDYTSLATFTAINSKALDLESDFDPQMWMQEYSRNKILGTNALTTDLVLQRKIIPYLFSHWNQKIGQMVNLDQLDIRLQAAPLANSILLASKIIERNMTLGAMWMGYNSPAELSAAVQAYGVVVDEKNTPYMEYDPVLASRMPVRLKAGGA